MPTENVSSPDYQNIKMFPKVLCNNKMTNFSSINCLPVQPTGSSFINYQRKPTIVPL